MSAGSDSLEELRRAAALRLIQARQAPREPSPPVAKIPRVDRQAPIPLSWSQLRLWFLNRLDPAAGAAYHMPAGLRLHGRLDAHALGQALARIVARHDILRTRFAEIDGEATQVIDDGATLAFVVHDLSGLRGNECAAAVDRLAFDNAMAPFDLECGPLVRAALLRIADDDHVLLVTQHHIVSDGWSVGVLVREFCALYAAFAAGQDDPLPPLAIQYADYAAWQRGWLAGARATAQREFWFEHLHGAPALLELPTDHPRPPRQSYRGSSIAFQVAPQLVAALRALSHRQGMTLFMTLLAAWSLLLSRLSGQADVVVGTAIANRPRTELEPLMGFFVNTLALRLRFDGDPTLADVLDRARQTVLQAYANQDLPFEQVVEALQPPRSMAHGPIFQAMFALDNTPPSTLTLPGLTLEPLASAHQTTHFDVLLSMNEAGDRLQGRIEFASDLFEVATIERMARQLQSLLQAFVDDASRPARRASLMSPQERSQVLHDFNATRRDFPRDQLLHERFAEVARRAPTAIALQAGERTLTYAELDADADRVARRLLALRPRPDDRVAVCASRSLELVVVLLGILKAGAAYLPLDPDHPIDRVSDMIADAAPIALVTDRRLGDIGGRAALPTFTLDELIQSPAPGEAATTPQARRLGSHQLAYVMYTSGSTGRPKGVMVEHRNVMRLAVNGGFADIGPGDRVAHAANPAFDASTWEIWAPLLNGGTCVVLSQEQMLEPRRLEHELSQRRVTAMWMTVGLFNRYVSQMSRAFGALDHLLIGGDALDPASVARLLDGGAAPRRLINGYGPTETTTFATTFPIQRADADRALPIGRPIGNTQVYVLDASREPVPVGVVGELWIGGDGVARGYLNRPDLTTERFVEDPFSDVPGARMYRTGDLGRWRADGTLEYLGRNDFQVKLRGFRVELGEIESCLLACEGVRDTVVMLREDAPGDKRLVAYVLPHRESTFDPAEIRRQLSTHLADYMLPSAFVRLDSLPLTGNGKLDRAALPAPTPDAYAVRVYEKPDGPIEQTLAQLWRELLGVAQVGRLDHFFELGGHSLMAIQLCARVRESLGADLPLREVFTRPTLRDLAQAVAQAAGAADAPIARADRTSALPLSWSQQRLWFLDRLDAAAGAAYHLPVALRLRGDLDVDALERAFGYVVQRHEALRTRFEEVDGQPVQRIDAQATIAIERHDLSRLEAGERERAVASHARANAQSPFDLARGPLLRVALLHLAADEHVLLVTQHHIVSDGWSMGVLVREVCAHYAALREGRAARLPDLAIQYADFAVWQRIRLDGEPLQARLEQGIAPLRDAPVLLDLPTDHARPARQSHRGASHAFSLAPARASALRELSRRHGVTLFMTLLAGWSLLLARLSGQPGVVIGIPVANRPRAELEPLIGLFANTIALHVRPQVESNVAGFLAQVRQLTLDGFAHQDLPFERIVEALNPPRTLAHSPVFQAMFSLDNTPHGQLELPGLAVSPMPGSHRTTQFDISLSMVEAQGGIEANIEFATDLFEPATIVRWAGHLQTLLDAMVADDAGVVGRLPWMTADEHRQVVDLFNPAAPVAPRDRGFVPAFERMARACPQAIAVEGESQGLSYAALDRAADRIAQRLVAKGVRPGDRVALCAGREPALIVGLLGILKAGAAYVPLDAALPAERLQYMLEDAAPALLLCAADVAVAGPTPVIPLPRVFDHGEDGDGAPAQPRVTPTPDDIAYVIYTSGSTGRPKGVQVPHRGVLNLWRALDATALADLAPGARVALNAAITFDASVQALVQLLSGHTVVLVPQAVRTDPAALLAFLRAKAIDVLDTTPAQLETLLAEDDEGLPARVLVGGEAIGDALWRAMGARRSTRFFNVYGPTECSVDTTCAEVTPGSAPNLGRPLPGTRVYVLDGAGAPVPVGVVGEMWIGGAGVAAGYLGRAELTAQRFVADPFAPTAGARMYRSGDLGRWRRDGVLEYVGRNDLQVKVRGFRIELGEIEAALRNGDELRDAVVVVRADRDGDRRLVAYIVAKEPGALDLAALRARLARFLPEYMMPAAYVALASLPLTSHGKVDRERLPAPETGVDGAAAGPAAAPMDAVEAAVEAAWREVLGLARVDLDQSFFDSGGHSLLAVRLMHRVNERFSTRLPVSTLFTSPTVRALARQIRALVAAPATAALASPLVALRRAPVSAPHLFCVHPIGGEALPYTALAAELDGWNVWGLQAPELCGLPAPATLEQLASAHADAIQSAGGSPRLLLGWSSGGRFAMAVAQALRERDDAPAHVFLLDTDWRPMAKLDKGRRGLDAVLHLVATLRGSAPTTAEVTAMIGEAAAKGWTVAELLREQAGEPPADLVAWLARWTQRPADPTLVPFVRRHARLAAAHLGLLQAAATRPPERTERITTLWASESGLHTHAPGRASGDLVIPGSHHSMLQAPHCARIAALVRDVHARGVKPSATTVRSPA